MRRALLVLVLVACAHADDLFEWTPGPEVVRIAHRAFVRGDVLTALIAARTGLLEKVDDTAVQANLLGLLDRAIERDGAGLPVSWSLPAGVRSLTLGTERVRRRPDARPVPGSGRGPERRRVKLTIGLAPGASVAHVKLVRAPDRVLVDTRTNRGSSGPWHSPRWGDFHWSFAPLDDDERAEGLYLLTLDLASGAHLDAWLPLPRAESSAAPLIRAPLPDEALATPNPVLRFEDFRSPEWRAGESRTLDVDVDRNEELAFVNPDRDENLWSFDRDEPALDALTVGPGPDLEPGSLPRLPPGRYLMRVTYREQRRFGPATLSRDSTTCVPFRVRDAAR